jgi:hypothetical protein
MLSAHLLAQPRSNGISLEEAMAQANELFRSHGIDPTGEGLDTPEGQQASKALAAIHPQRDLSFRLL